MSRSIRLGLAALVFWGAAAFGIPVASAAEGDLVLGKGTLTQPVGLATDHANRRYWAIPAGQGSPGLSAFDERGKALGTTTSRDRLSSVQALAFSSQQLFIGDVGGTRERVTILQMDRPLPGTEINKSIAISLRYPDGAHDAAAIMADADERLYVVTRGKRAGIYAAPATPKRNAPWATTPPPVNDLTRVADAPSDVTDAAILVDGRIALLSTSGGVQVLDPASYAVLGTVPVPAGLRGGSLTQSLDQTALWVGTKATGALTSVPIPGPAPSQPTAAPKKRPDAAPQVDEEQVERPLVHTGTVIAVAAAVAVAVLAGTVVLIKR